MAKTAKRNKSKGKAPKASRPSTAKPTTYNSTLYGLGGGPVYTSKPVHRVIRTAVADAKRRIIGEKRPLRIVSIPSAKFEQGTFSEHIGWIKGFFPDTDRYQISILHAFHEKKPDLAAAAAMLDAADVLFMPGGSTEWAIKYLRKTGLDKLILAAVERGVVIIGHSAGLIAWFQVMHTDSDHYGKADKVAWKYKVGKAFGVVANVWVCPHAADNARQYTFNKKAYGKMTTRRQDFVAQLRTVAKAVGIAVDGNTAIKLDMATGRVTVLGTGKVTTHKWAGGVYAEAEYVASRSFNLYELAA